MANFTALDYGILIAYLLVVAVLGVYVGRNQHSTKDYFLGGRKIPWWSIGISVMATQAGAITFIGTPGWGYEGGLERITTFINVPLAMAFLIVTIVPFFYRTNVYTAYEYLEKRFDKKTRLLTGSLFLISRGLATGITLFAPALVLSVITGWNINFTIILMAVLSIAYTVFGGISAVIWTDVAQMIVLWFGAIISAIAIYLQIPGGWSEILQVSSDAQLLDAFDFSFDLSVEYSIWAGIFGGFFLHAAYFGVDQSQIQRVLTSKSVRESQYSLIFTGFLLVPQMLLFLFIGVMLYAFYSHTGAPQYDDINELFPRFIVNELPTGISGLIIAGVFAGAMSSLDSALNSLSAVSIQGFYKKYMKKNASEAHYLSASRWATILWGIYAMIFAFFAGNLGPLIEVINKIGSYFYGSLLGVFILAIFTRRSNGLGAFTGVIAGMISVLLVDRLADISYLYNNLVGAVVAVAVGYFVSFLSSKPDAEQLDQYTYIWNKEEAKKVLDKRSAEAIEVMEQDSKGMKKWPFILIAYFFLLVGLLILLQIAY